LHVSDAQAALSSPSLSHLNSEVESPTNRDSSSSPALVRTTTSNDAVSSSIDHSRFKEYQGSLQTLLLPSPFMLFRENFAKKFRGHDWDEEALSSISSAAWRNLSFDEQRLWEEQSPWEEQSEHDSEDLRRQGEHKGIVKEAAGPRYSPKPGETTVGETEGDKERET
jgi:hypothetical protein